MIRLARGLEFMVGGLANCMGTIEKRPCMDTRIYYVYRHIFKVGVRCFPHLMREGGFMVGGRALLPTFPTLIREVSFMVDDDGGYHQYSMV